MFLQQNSREDLMELKGLTLKYSENAKNNRYNCGENIWGGKLALPSLVKTLKSKSH